MKPAVKPLKYLPTCRPVVVINVRGSGQKGPKDLSRPAHGLPADNPGRQVLTDLQTLVGPTAWSNISPTDLPYAAIPVNIASKDYFLFDYDVSRKDGESSLALLLSALGSRCPAAQVVLVGYSQGADAIGDQLPRVPAAQRAKIVGVVLFGDPRFRPTSAAAQGSFNPSRSGIRGARPEFPADVPVRSYCRNLDPVCQGLVGFRVYRSTLGTPTVVTEGFDKGSHMDYASNEAHSAAQWLRSQLSSRGLLALPPPTASLTPLDVSFVIDSTGSMSDAIDSVRGDIGSIRAQLAAQATSFQAALSEYRDEPDEDSAFQSRRLIDLTPDEPAFANALAGLEADGGGDFPESVFSGLGTAMGVSWRPSSARAVVLVGDAPPKDPEPVTGATVDSTVRRAAALGAPIHTLVVNDDPDAATAFKTLSDRTFGLSTAVKDGSQVAEAIVTTLQRNAGAPVASATARSAVGVRRAQAGGEQVAAAYPGVPTLLSAATSVSPLGDRLTYTWDFGDGQTVSTPNPVIAHVWAGPFAGDVSLTVTDSAGRKARTVQPLTVAGTAPPAVGAPLAVKVRRTRGKLSVRWRRPSIGAPVGYRILDGSRTLERLDTPGSRRFLRVAVANVARCKPLRLRVEATDALGRIAISRPSRPVVIKPADRLVKVKGRSRLIKGRCGGKR